MRESNSTFIALGGVGEIGGNKFLIRDGDTRILLDFGVSYADRRRFYSEPLLSPRDEKELFEFGMLPKLQGLYKFEESEPSIQGVFLSHSHGDHSACISFLNRKIPVYCGETTATIIRALYETRTKSLEADISGLRFETFRTGSKIRLGSIEVEPIHVDHSVPAAYGFIVHTSEGTLVYTGDLRVHGPKSRMTDEFIERARQAKADALLAEGTNLIGATLTTEAEVQSKLSSIIQASSKLVLADFSNVDVDRFRTFYNVAKENGRTLAISLRQAHLLSKLAAEGRIGIPDVAHDKNVVVYQRSKKRYYEWEKSVLSSQNVVEASDIKNMQSKTVLVSSASSFKELIDIRPEPGSCFILSISEPFNEEQEFEFERVVNWLDHFGLPMYHVHCSGHIMPDQLKSAIARIAPKTVYPIHTDHPELYAKFISGVASVTVPQKNVTYPVRS
ncbi:MAG: MBL fold metallo-hydrolase [Candidatus Bathyarchaeia archaeon]